MVRVASYVVALSVGLAVPAMAQDAKATGEKVYAEQKCSVCHAVAGKGNAKGPLDEVGSKLTADEIRAWITDAKGDDRQDEGAAQAGDEGLHAAEGRRRRARRLPVGDEKEIADGAATFG